MTATGAWPLSRLVSELARAGWDELLGRRGGGYRGVLRALADLLPHGSAAGYVTAPQLADGAGLKSERWARFVLTGLEEAGIITWQRGTIRAGKPTPSFIRVNKRAIADLVNRARRVKDARLAKRAAATAHRVRTTLRTRSVHRTREPVPDKQRNPDPRAELRPTLPLFEGGNGAAQRPAPVLTDTGQAIYATVRGNRAAPIGAGRARLQRARAAMAALAGVQTASQPPESK